MLRPEINDATIRLLARRGVDVEVAPGAGCCGALVHHMGREADAIAMAKRNIDAWTRVIDKGDPVDAVIVNASGCGTTVKDYGHLLAREPKYAERAAKIAGMARDVTEFIGSYDLGPPKRWSSLRVAYHSACSMQHGQRIIDEPRKLLRNAGFTVVEVPEGHLCCGSAGSYNILQPEIAADLRDRKVDNIKSRAPGPRRHRQHRLPHAAGQRHGHPHRPYRRAARLGLRRPDAARAGGAGEARQGRARGQAAVRGHVIAWI